MIKTESFITLVRRLAKTIGRETAIRVVFEGDGAHTDGRNITLPAVVPGGYLTKWEASVLMGYLDHEVGHVRWTDFKPFKEVASEKDGLLHYLLNVFEDVREENLYIEKYPGAKEDLNTLADKIDKQILEKAMNQGWGTVEVLPAVLNVIYDEAYTYRDRKLFLPKDLADFKGGSEIRRVMKGLPGIQSTRGILELAKKVKEILLQYYKQDVEKKRAEGEKQLLLAMGAGGIGNDELKKKLQQAGSVEEVISILADALNTDKARIVLIEGIMKPHTDPQSVQGSDWRMPRGKLILPPVTTAKDQILVYPREDLDEYRRTLAGLREAMQRLSRALAIYFRSRAWKKWDHGREEGTLDNHALWGLRAGSRRLYKQPRQNIVQESALVVMADLSGSMNAFMLREAMIVLSEAVFNVPKMVTMIAGFTTLGDSTTGGEGYGREEALYIPIFKDFKDSLKQARGRIGAIERSRSTPLGEAYAIALDRVMTRPERKRAVLMVTDGNPAIFTADGRHSEEMLMEKTHQQAKKFGVKTLGLNIRIDAMRPFVDYSKLVSSSSQLAPAVLEMAKDLVDGRV